MTEGIEVGITEGGNHSTKWKKKEPQTAQPKSNHRLSLFDARFYR
jgi:hypothetical protein